MKKAILTLALATSFTAFAQTDATVVENAKVTYRLFQNFFAPSCVALPQLAICDFSLQNEILVTDKSGFDRATLSVVTQPSVHSEMAARNLSAKYNFDYRSALKSAAVLEAWVKRIQSHRNETSQAELESVYLTAMGVSLNEVMQMAKTQDHNKLDLISESIARKFKTSSRESKLFLENLLANELIQ